MLQRLTYILCLSSALLLSLPLAAKKKMAEQPDTVPLFKGLAVSFDIVGPAMNALSDYGDYEAALRVNLKNKIFPIVEIGIGTAEREDDVTEIYYKTTAPFFRIGCDWNLLKNKNSGNRLYGGFRYAFTSYKVDVARDDISDPVWGGMSAFAVTGESCNQHWLEGVLGIDAKVWGPLHLGWTFRYKRRITHKDTSIGRTWYVPGFGIAGDTRLGVNFNVIIDI